MKITSILFRRNRLPNGHIFRGKDRLVKKVEPVHLRRLEQDFAVEEQNMFYLRHPYLSEVSCTFSFLYIADTLHTANKALQIIFYVINGYQNSIIKLCGYS